MEFNNCIEVQLVILEIGLTGPFQAQLLLKNIG